MVELLGVNTCSAMYAALGARLGLRYDVLLGVEPPLPRRWWRWQPDADHVVDVDRLVALLRS